MIRLKAIRRVPRAFFLLCAGLALPIAGCVQTRELNPYATTGVNPDSTVSAEVVAVSHVPGAYPHFAQVPALPTDVRTVPAWRTAVVTEWHTKRQTEREAAALPFTLVNTGPASTEAWAARTRDKIPPTEAAQPASTAERSEAFAAAERARATPPPPPQ